MTKRFEVVSMIGLGYIGLPTAAILASRKIKVIGVDTNSQVVDLINRGEIHIVEPELDIIVSAVVNKKYLRATILPEEADAFLIAVPTPFTKGHQPDLNLVEAAAKSIAHVLKKGDLVILESTSPVGTTEQLAEWLASERPDLTFPQQQGELADINIAYCPERVLPGKVVQELVNNDRIIGGMTSRCSQRAIELYKIFVEAELIATSSRTAEMCKLTENSFRDVNIAFANELSIVCDEIDINVWELISLANRHPRVNILKPGPGVGGHCIAVDPWFIVSKTPKQARLIHMAREVNDSKPLWVIDKVKQAIAEHLALNPNKTICDVVIACFGLSFKPDIDDLRESPALEICRALVQSEMGEIVAVEPNVEEINCCLGDNEIKLLSINNALNKADIVLGLVAHKQFRDINISTMCNKVIIDACGVWL